MSAGRLGAFPSGAPLAAPPISIEVPLYGVLRTAEESGGAASAGGVFIPQSPLPACTITKFLIRIHASEAVADKLKFPVKFPVVVG